MTPTNLLSLISAKICHVDRRSPSSATTQMCHLDRSRTASSSCAVDRPAELFAKPGEGLVPAGDNQVPRSFSFGSHGLGRKWALAPQAALAKPAVNQAPRSFSFGSHGLGRKWALAPQAALAKPATNQVPRGFSLGSHRRAIKWALAPGVCLLSALAIQAQTGPNTTTLNPPTTIAITGGKLLTITHGTIENGTLILDHGKITAVGPASTPIPSGATIVDAHGMTVYPGLFDAETNLGLTEVSSDENSNDLVETSDEIEPQMHVVDAFHAETVRIPVNRINGVTTAIVAPASSDSISGQDALIQLYGRDAATMILTPDIALAMNFDSGVKRGGRGGGKFPSTRMGVASQLRQTFYDAQAYMAEIDKAIKDKKEAPKRDLKLEALIPYLKGEKPVVLGAEASQDVEVAMAIAQEFHLKVILNHVTHAQDILDKIAAWHVPVIVGSIYDAPQANERFDAVFSLPAELHKRGVKIAFSTINQNGPVADSRNLPYAAGYAVAFGLPYDEALKAITLNPAEIFGVGDKLGSLDIGKIANVVIANGDPLDVRTSVQQVFINGIPIPMTSRQTQLRDEYAPLTSKPKP